MILLVMLFILVFTICWIVGIVIWVKMMRTKSQMKRLMAARNVKFNDGFGNLSVERTDLELKQGGMDFLNLVLRFAPNDRLKEFVNRFVDMEAVRDLKSVEITKILERRARLMSTGIRFWIVGFSSGVILFVVIKAAEWLK